MPEEKQPRSPGDMEVSAALGGTHGDNEDQTSLAEDTNIEGGQAVPRDASWRPTDDPAGVTGSLGAAGLAGGILSDEGKPTESNDDIYADLDDDQGPQPSS